MGEGTQQVFCGIFCVDCGTFCADYTAVCGCSDAMKITQTTECVEKRALRRARDRERKRRARQDPALRAAEAAKRKARRQDPSLHAEEIEVKRRRREDPAVRAAEAEAQRRRRKDPAVRAAEIEAQRRKREDPAVRAAEAEAQRRRREDRAVRAAENEARRRRRRREDPAVRAAEAQAKRERYAKTQEATNVCTMLFRDDPFGYSCSVCDRLWFTLTALPSHCYALLQEAFPTADLKTFYLCASCLHLISNGHVPTLSTSNGCRYPVKSADLPPFNREPYVPRRRWKASSAVDGIATVKESASLCKKHSAKSKGTSTCLAMHGRSTQTDVCAKADRVTQTARAMVGRETQT